ncbi:hypothetical protein AC1031_004360 [Aphanomyces cochlioides]|nr:hypothetical protein AC1031_004360 [Aphanomyces cochlioides]
MSKKLSNFVEILAQEQTIQEPGPRQPKDIEHGTEQIESDASNIEGNTITHDVFPEDFDCTAVTQSVDFPLDSTTAQPNDNEVSDGPLIDAEWPASVVNINHTLNPRGISIHDIGEVDWCKCEERCRIDHCPNARSGMFCANNNCVLQDCGNRLKNLGGLVLKMGRLGYTLTTKNLIAQGTVVGEYSGILTTHDFTRDKTQQNSYVIALGARSTRGKKIFIDAEKYGNITRFINHS